MEYQSNHGSYNIIWYNEQTQITIDTNYSVWGNKRCKYVELGAGFDCETTKVNDKCTFVYIWQFAIGNIIYLCRNTEDIHDFIIKLSIAMQQYTNTKLIVWIANISYEWSFFREYIKDIVTDIKARTKRQILSFECLGNIEFRECLKVYGNSLAQIAKNYTTTHKMIGDLDYELTRTNKTPLSSEELQYCINDVAILSELTTPAFDKYLKQGKKLPLTATGIVRNDVKSSLTNAEKKWKETENLEYTKNKKMYDTLRTYLYSGGLTHSNTMYVGKLLHNVKCADLTSAYPWALCTQSFPAGRIISTNNTKRMLEHKHWFAHIIIHNLETKNGHSTISIHKAVSSQNAVLDNGRIWSAEKVELWVSEIDFENIKAIYKADGVQFIHRYYFTKSTPCPNFILDNVYNYYNKKQQLKLDGLNKTKEYKEAKAKVNSIYGMLVTEIHSSSWEWTDEQVKNVTQKWDKECRTIFNPFVGYWCTAYVRQRLIECISKFGNNIVQYDTDSIYYTENNELDEYISSINQIITAENNIKIPHELARDLGLWDYNEKDDFYTDYMPLGAKRYVGRHKDDSINITFAGAKDSDMISESKRLNKDIFDYVKHFSISEDYSTKLCASYFDDLQEGTITDYQGNTSTYSQFGGTVLNYATFNATVAQEYGYFQKTYKTKFGE